MRLDARGWLAGLTVLTLVGSLAIKFALLSSEAPPEPARKAMLDDLMAGLQQHDYAVSLARESWAEEFMVVATKAACRVYLLDVTLTGMEYERVAERRLNEGRPLRYFYAGRYRDDFPRLQAEWRWRLQRELAAIGIRTQAPPVIAVAAPPRCMPAAAVLNPLRLGVARRD
jgi:hypothetical protein